ncbi:MAG: Holliday junction branch migration protein RuvA [Bryobacteraceae bacterium]
MIAHLRGVLLEKHPNQAVIEAGGVGYDVTIPVSTYTALPEVGAEARLRIHTHVREDAIQLYGFSSVEERALFEKLIGVSGIGPKLAITVLSGIQATELVRIIRGSDVALLTRVPGIGKKTAERIVLELHDKLETLGAPPAAPKSAGAILSDPIEADVVSALTNLGAQPGAAQMAVRKAVSGGAPKEFEPLFRRALELLR